MCVWGGGNPTPKGCSLTSVLEDTFKHRRTHTHLHKITAKFKKSRISKLME